jgi:hypothetical protein
MPPKAILRLQLLDMRQGPEVAELVRLPTDNLLPERLGARLRCFSTTGTSHYQVSSRSELVSQAGTAGVARVEFELDTLSRELGPGIEAVAARGVYQLAPTNTAWPQLATEMATREDEAVRASLLSLERSLRWNEVSTYPTLVQWEIALRGPGAKEPWAPLTAALASAFSSSWTPRGMTGYGDILDENVFKEDVLGRLAPWPRAYPRLASAFEDLYPILLGPVELCAVLKEALRCGLWEVSTAPGETIGLLHIPDSILTDKEIRAKTAGLVIERNEEARKRPPNIESGEHQVGKRVLFTPRRLRELIDKGAVAAPPEGFTFAPIIDEKHWRVLGLSEDAVLMELWQTPVLDEFRREVDTVAALSRELDAKAQLWTAYSLAFRRRFRTREVLDYIRRLAGAPGDS